MRATGKPHHYIKLAVAAGSAGFAALVTQDTALAQAAEPAATGIGGLVDWVMASYERAPALVLGLAALLSVPPLALIGLALGGRRTGGEAGDVTQVRTQVGPREAPRGPVLREKVSTGFVPMRPMSLAIEVETADGVKRHAISGALLRIGRESDNDIVLGDVTVHRYHAAVHRTEDGFCVITDLSSEGGNGVVLNGRAVQEARLSNGDRIELGRARLRFVALPK